MMIAIGVVLLVPAAQAQWAIGGPIRTWTEAWSAAQSSVGAARGPDPEGGFADGISRRKSRRCDGRHRRLCPRTQWARLCGTLANRKGDGPTPALQGAPRAKVRRSRPRRPGRAPSGGPRAEHGKFAMNEARCQFRPLPDGGGRSSATARPRQRVPAREAASGSWSAIPRSAATGQRRARPGGPR